MTLIRHKKDRFIPERSYHQTEQKAFFGRETETSKLSDLVMYQKLVLVFGETGVGKSSLLRAGLMPKLSLSGFYPIYVTLQKEVEETPLSTVQKQVALHLPALPTSSIPPTGFLPETFEETTEVAKQTLSDSIINKLTDSNIGEIEQLPSLWNSLVLRDFYYNDEPATPVLILDQFEHFFNYTKSEQQQFITEIAKVAQSNVHLVFCLQSNYLSQLQQLSEAIPAIFHHRFLLKGMTQEVAKTVFKQTIHLDTDHFATQSFDIAPKTLHLITKHLIVGNGENVSLPALQIIGQYLEQQVLQNQESLPNQLITVDDNFFAKTQQIDQILGDYYTRGLPKNQKGSLWTRLLDATFSWRNILVFIALTVALLAWSYAYWQTDQSITKQKQALKAVASTLAAESRNALEQEVYPTALRLAEYAWETDSSNAQSYAALLNSYFNSRLYAETSGHRDEVLYADFAPNGQQFLTTSKDSLIRIWDLDGTLRQTLKGHKAYVFFAQFSNSGRYIVSTSRDNTARLWDRKGHLLHTLDHHQGFVNYAAFSPNDSLIVTAAMDNAAMLWNEKGEIIDTLKGHKAGVLMANFDAAGERIVTASDDYTAKIWQRNKKGRYEVQHDLEGHGFFVLSAVFSPDGKTVLTASSDHTAKLWDAQTGKLLNTLSGHNSYVVAAHFSPDGSTILTASTDTTVKIWNARGNLIRTLPAYSSAVVTAQFSENGERIIVACSDGTAIVHDKEGNVLHNLKGHQGSLTNASIAPNGQFVVTTSKDQRAKIWNFSELPILRLGKHRGAVINADFSSDSQYIITASSDSTANVWSIEGSFLFQLKGHQDRVISARFSPKGNFIVTTSTDRTAKIWDTTGRLIRSLEGHDGYVVDAVFSDDSQYLATAAADNTARIWELATGRLISVLEGHTGAVLSVQFGEVCADCSYDAELLLLTTSNDNSAKLWNLKGKHLETFQSHTQLVRMASFSPDGTQILTASKDNTAKLWSLVMPAKGEVIHNLYGHSKYVRHAEFSPDGKNILTASNDRTAKIWDKNGTLLTTLEGHEDYVITAHFSPNGQFVLTASKDNTVKLWNLDGDLIYSFDHHTDPIRSANFSPDGNKIVMASFDKTTSVCYINPTAIITDINQRQIAFLSPKALIDYHIDDVDKAIGGNKVAQLISNNKVVEMYNYAQYYTYLSNRANNSPQVSSQLSQDAIQLYETLIDSTQNPIYTSQLGALYWNIAQRNYRNNNLDNAVALMQKIVNINAEKYVENPNLIGLRNNVIQSLLTLSHYEIANQNYIDALRSVEDARALDPDNNLVQKQYAHTLLYNGKITEAQPIYESLKDKTVAYQQSYGKVVLEDFKTFAQRGATNPAIAQVYELIAGKPLKAEQKALYGAE